MTATMLRILTMAIFSCYSVSALYKDEAGNYDWHTKLVGIPKFAHIESSSQQDIITIGTSKNVLASLSASSGEINWRHAFGESESIISLYADEQDSVLTLTDDSTSTHLRSWNKYTGLLIWSVSAAPSAKSSHSCVASIIRHEKKSIAIFPSCDIVAVSDKGKVVWAFKHQHQEEHAQIISSDNSLWLISWTAETGTLTTRELSISDGSILTTTQTKDADAAFVERIFLTGSESEVYCVWNNGRQSRAINLKTGHGFEVSLSGDVLVEKLGETAKPTEFLAKTATNTYIARLKNNKLVVVHKFSLSTQESSADLFTSHTSGSASGRLRLQSDKYVFDLVTAGASESHIAVTNDVFLLGLIEKVFMGTTLIRGDAVLALISVSADGSVTYSRNGKIVWTRDESLSYIADSAFLSLPKNTLFSEQLDELREEPEVSASISMAERYVRRWSVHIAKFNDFLKDLFVGQGILQPKSNTTTVGISDAHGFKKFILFASSTGKVNALDSLTGSPVWSRYFESFHIHSIHIVRHAHVKNPPVIALVGTDASEKNTIIWRVNGLTGEDYVSSLQPQIKARTNLQGIKHGISMIEIAETDEHTSIMVFMDQPTELKIFPDTPAAHAAFEPNCLSFYTYRAMGDTGLQGYALQVPEKGRKAYRLEKTWNLEFPQGEKLHALSDRASEVSVASIGRVLGDRTVLYKYLSPNMLGVATVRKDADGTIVSFFYIVDTVSGSIHYRTAHHAAGPANNGASPMHILQVENWFVYTAWNYGPDATNEEIWNGLSEATLASNSHSSGKAGQTSKKARKAKAGKTSNRASVPDAKQLEIVVIEMYENSKPDKRVDSPTLSSYSNSRPGIYAQAYVFPLPITAIGVTQTLAGITTREVLFGLDTGFLYGLNKKLLDPRRTLGKQSAEDKEAGIFPYVASLGLSTYEIASYGQEVLGIQKIISSPTNLESTSLVASYGLDLFCTRRMPSQAFDVLSADFNYAGLIATIVALVVGIFVAKHYADKKRLNDQWK